MVLGQPFTREQLENAFQDAKTDAFNELIWYESRRPKWRAGSYLARIVAVLGLVPGLTLPVFAGAVNLFGAEPPFNLSLAYVCLVIGAVAFALDQTFMVSQTWSRYMLAEARIKSLVLDCEVDWQMLKLSLPDGNVPLEIGQPALERFKKLRMDTRAVVEEETLSWGNQLEKAVKALGNQIQRHTATVEKKLDEQLKEIRKQRKTE